MTQQYEIDAWLGDTVLIGDQRDRFAGEVEAIAARYPDPDDQADRDEAMSATVQWMLGETTIEQAAAALAAARGRLASAMILAQQIARLAVLDGGAEATIARQIGLDRMTVRKVLGK